MVRYLPMLLITICLFVQDDIAGDAIPLTREQIMITAEELSLHRWICREENRHASCVTRTAYDCEWEAGEEVIGIAYDWGGMDGIEEFAGKLSRDYAAGSHSWHGVTDCTAGLDCSGFVSRCWGFTRPEDKFGTMDVRTIAGRPKYNWYSDMKPGDALVKPGSHIVLFAGYREDGNPMIYEASGSAGRIILNERSTWSRYIGYYPLQYHMVIED